MICAIVLAAGESTRFGSPKPLASIHGTPAVRVICDTLLAAVDRVVVVLGHEAEAVHPALPRDERVKSVVNGAYRRGMTSSFQAGLKLVPSNAEGILLMPVDMPFLRPATVELIVRTFKKELPLILVPAYDGRPGHPPVFSAPLTDDFKALGDTEPLSNVQHRFKDRVLRLPVEDPGVIRTFSTPQELARLLQTPQNPA
ncbi:MAG: nucleotidyltransferase family protein [Deltaproteobacteria bacterium]